ncbi:MAG: VCBS repeat-containing protein, partial [Flavobacteriales bacterium]|nr:VCBS repeat-containing protein [Flavobacteriales bacterium]
MNRIFLTTRHWVLIALSLPLLNSAQQFEMLDAHIICPEELGWSALALGDIDGDGDLDLIADSYRYPAYYLNDGTGSFSERTEIAFNYPFQERGVPTLIDMDGDMDLDLVMSTGGLYADVIWMSNDGAGGFSEPILINSDDVRVSDYQVVDLDMDGDQDVLMSLGWIGTGGEKVVSYINDGTGGFGSQQLIRSGANSLVRAMDMEDDGDMDVVRYHASDELSWLANDGAMNFAVESAPISTSATARMIRVSDMDGDDDLDLVLSESSDGLVEWFANDGIGGFMFGGGIEETGPITHMELVDIDADTDIDVLIQDANGLTLYANDGTGQLFYVEALSPESEAGYYFIAGDIDGDGDQDVIDSHFNDPIYLHRFESGEPIAREGLSSFILEPNWCNAADIDGDGDLDAVSTTPFGDEVAWYDNPGTGSDYLPWTKNLISTELSSPDRIIAADMDDDGDQDLVVSSSTNGGGLAYLEQGPTDNWSITLFPVAPSGIIAALYLADIEGDDDLDIFYATANAQTVSLIRNQGGGAFDPALDLVSLDHYANSIESPDLDGDGLQDLLLASRFGDE